MIYSIKFNIVQQCIFKLILIYKTNANVLKQTISVLYVAPRLPNAFFDSVVVSRWKLQGKSWKSSPVVATRINEVRKRIIMIDDEDEDLP